MLACGTGVTVLEEVVQHAFECDLAKIGIPQIFSCLFGRGNDPGQFVYIGWHRLVLSFDFTVRTCPPIAKTDKPLRELYQGAVTA